MRQKRARRTQTFLALLLVAVLCLPTGHLAAAPSAPAVVVRMTPAAYQRLAPAQVTTAVDYGGFVWVEMTSAQATALPAGAPYEPQPHATRIGLAGFHFDTRQGEPDIPANLRATLAPDEAGFHLVQFLGPARDEWLADLESTGLLALQYVPQNAYLVWGTSTQLRSAEAASPVRWTGAYHPAYRLSSALRTNALRGETGLVENANVLVYAGPGDDGPVKETLAAIERLGGHYVQGFDLLTLRHGQIVDAVFALDAATLDDVARLPHVLYVDYASPQPGLDDEMSTQIVAGEYLGGVPYTGYRDWLAAKSVDGSGVRIAVVDTGIDYDHPDLGSRIVAGVSYPGAPASPPGTDGLGGGHGTHSAGIVGGDATVGYGDASGFLYGLGVAPGVDLVAQNPALGSSWPPSGGWQQLSKDSVKSGAVGSSNSWNTGATGAQGYSSASVVHDRMVRDADFNTINVREPLTMVFSAGNEGPGVSTITEPKEAKNLIVVGSSLNYRAGSIDAVSGTSSRGPCLDGRLAPTVVAPGDSIASTRNDAGGTCASAIPGTANYYAYCSGTSMAAPHVAGGVALITQWWKETHGGATPSPAMVKALLVNGAVDMGTPDVPNNAEGWGRVNLDNVIHNDEAMVYHDQDLLFTSSGQTWETTGNVHVPLIADPSKPLKVTLAWTDAPGMVGGDAWVNDLDLEVTVDGVTYKGNDFANGWSVVGGSADHRNNVECVYIQKPGAASVKVKVIASTIAGDGVPYNGDLTDQDFALVVYNMVQYPDFGVSIAPSDQDICTPQVVTYSVPVEAIAGYSETVTLTLGGLPANTDYAFVPTTFTPPLVSALVVTATGETSAGAYPIVVTGTAESGRIHTATVDLAVNHARPPAPVLLSPADGASGVPLQTTFQWSPVPEATSYRIQVSTEPLFSDPIVDVAGLSAHTYTATLADGTCYFWRVMDSNGCGEGTFSATSSLETARHQWVFQDDLESGDGQWSHAAALGVDGWALATSNYRSSTHAWFAPNATTVTDDRLWTTAFPVVDDTVLLFWHRYNLEPDHDGAVVEISTDNGITWSDLGPHIVQTPYNHVIATGSGNPIGGRPGWSGDNGTWEQVKVDLSGYAGAQQARVRWRLACDSLTGREGWYVDDVEVIAPLPPNDFDHESCLFANTPSHFVATGSDAYAYTWDFGGAGTGVGLDTARPTFTYTAPGNFVVQLTRENLCTSEVITHEVFVCEYLVQDAQLTTSPDPHSGVETTFTVTVIGTPPLTYTWDFGDGDTISSSSLAPLWTNTHTYATGGDYTVTLTLSNCSGCGYEQITQAIHVAEHRFYLPLAVRDHETPWWPSTQGSGIVETMR